MLECQILVAAFAITAYLTMKQTQQKAAPGEVEGRGPSRWTRSRRSKASSRLNLQALDASCSRWSPRQGSLCEAHFSSMSLLSRRSQEWECKSEHEVGQCKDNTVRVLPFGFWHLPPAGSTPPAHLMQPIRKVRNGGANSVRKLIRLGNPCNR